MVRLLLLLVTWTTLSVAAAEPADAAVEETAKLTESPLFDPPDGPTADTRTQNVSEQLRCPVCQALSVAASSSDAARTMKARIRELVELGYSEDQIMDYFADRYGEWVRLEPPASGLNWIIWLGPVVVVVAGALWVLKKARPDAQIGPPAAELAAGDSNPENDEYRRKILAELEEGVDS